jgi:hypothetical protein
VTGETDPPRLTRKIGKKAPAFRLWTKTSSPNDERHICTRTVCPRRSFPIRKKKRHIQIMPDEFLSRQHLSRGRWPTPTERAVNAALARRGEDRPLPHMVPHPPLENAPFALPAGPDRVPGPLSREESVAVGSMSVRAGRPLQTRLSRPRHALTVGMTMNECMRRCSGVRRAARRQGRLDALSLRRTRISGATHLAGRRRSGWIAYALKYKAVKGAGGLLHGHGA